MVKSIFSILTARQTSILSGAVIIMATTMLSKVFGLIRTRLLFHYFTPEKADIYFASMQLPDLIFQIFILSALSIAFIPVFIEHFEKNGKDDAFKMAGDVLALSLIFFTGFALLILIFSQQFTGFMFPGFSADKIKEIAGLTRIITFGQIIFIVGAFFIGILQSFQRFLIPALAGVFYNIGIIIGTILLSDRFGIAGPAIGVVIGAFLHTAIQYPLIRSLGFRLTFSLSFVNQGVRDIARMMSVRSLGLVVEQIGEKIGLGLTSFLTPGSLTYLTIAQSLQVLPIGLFGVALAQAAYPVLSTERARNKPEEFKVTLLTTMHQIAFFVLPAAAVLVVLRIPVVRLVYGAAQFDWSSTVLTGMTLAFLAIGLVPQALSLLLIRGFYAFKDTKTPVIVSFITIALNIFLSVLFILVYKLPVWSLGLSNSVSTILSGILLFIALNRKVGRFDLRQVFAPFAKMVMATIIMGMALYIPVKLLDQVIFDTTRTVNLIILTGISSIFALSVYVLLVWYLQVKELVTFINLGKRIIEKVISPDHTTSEEIIHDTDAV